MFDYVWGHLRPFLKGSLAVAVITALAVVFRLPVGHDLYDRILVAVVVVIPVMMVVHAWFKAVEAQMQPKIDPLASRSLAVAAPVIAFVGGGKTMTTVLVIAGIAFVLIMRRLDERRFRWAVKCSKDSHDSWGW